MELVCALAIKAASWVLTGEAVVVVVAAMVVVGVVGTRLEVGMLVVDSGIGIALG